MRELPLFPLNTVLFPGVPISLHIFEPRYKLMVELCLRAGEPFGVVLIKEGMEALGPLAEPHPIGCSAQITQVERLDDGRMNIVAVGLERFQIHAIFRDKPYLIGSVESFPLNEGNTQIVARAGERLRPWVERYLAILSRASQDTGFSLDRLPHDPKALGYLAAALAQIPLDQKQSLLATEQASALLTDIRAIYRREVALLGAMIEREAKLKSGLFSPN